AVEKISEITTRVILHAPEDYQRPPDVVARWMAGLPPELWQNTIGSVASEWLRTDADAATAWLNQLQPERRNVAVADLCRSRWTDDAEQTFSLGFTIRDQGLRDQVLGEFARKFGET